MSDRFATRPPVLSRRLLAWVLPPAVRRAIMAELDERFERIAEEDEAHARRWYRRQTLLTIAPWRLIGLWIQSRSTREHREAPVGWIRGIVRDVAHGARRLRRRPGLSAAAIAVLALGIGGATGIYGIFGFFRDLGRVDFPRAENMRVLAVEDSTGRVRPSVDVARYRRLAPLLPPSVRSTVIHQRRALIRDGGAASSRPVVAVDPAYFQVTGMPLSRGRGLNASDRGRRVAVISHRSWRRRFGGDPAVLGSVLYVDREPHTVVGVVREGFDGAAYQAAWVPLDLRSLSADASVQLFLRGSEGRDQGLAGLEERLSAAERANAPAAKVRIHLLGLDELGSPSELRSLRLLFAFLGALSLLVLAIAAANVANLGAALVLDRRRELALRRSMGASSWRVVRLVVVEHVLLGLAAGAAAVVVVVVLSRLIPLWLPPSSMELVTFEIRPAHLWVAGILALASAVGSALLPALRVPPTRAVLRSGPGSGHGGGPGTVQRSLVVAQVTATVFLLTTAGLLVRSTQAMQSVETGLVPENGSVFDVQFHPDFYGPAEVAALRHRLAEQVRTLPGVTHVAWAAPTPVIGLAGARVARPGSAEALSVRRSTVSEEYFDAVGTAVVSGRAPRPSGGAEAALSRDLAERLWPGADALGRTVTVDGEAYRVVGTVEAGAYGMTEVQPFVFVPPSPSSPAREAALVVRSGAGSGELFSLVRRTARSLDPDLPVESLGTLDDLLDRALLFERAGSGLAAILGLLALVIGVVGIYAHFSHHVSGRRRSIAVRMMVGAPRGRVLRDVLVGGLALTGIGLLVGGILAVAAGTALRSFLFDVAPIDPLTLATVTAGITLAVALALSLPARRAAVTDPMEILRQD